MTVSSIKVQPAGYSGMPAVQRQELRGNRTIFFCLAVLHGLVCRLLQEYLFAPADVWDYMGVIWYDAPLWREILALGMAALPALFVPMRVTRAGDLAILILYGILYVPTVAMQPNLSLSSLPSQLTYTIISLAGLALLCWMTRIRIDQARPVGGLRPKTFDMILYASAIVTLVMYGLFSPARNLVLDLAVLYESRADFFSSASQMPMFMNYLFVNSSLSLAPLMVARGLYHRQWSMVGLALLLAYMTFVTTSLRSMLFSVAFVGAVTILTMWKRPPAVSLFAFFLGIAAVCVGLDAILPEPLPTFSYGLHYRLFGNAALLSDAYHSYFDGAPKIYLSQSFLSPFLESPLWAPYQLLVGEAVTDVPGNHANGNFVADAFANGGYVGVLLAYGLLGGIILFYQRLAARKHLRVAALGLVGPAFYLTNAGVHSAILSGGVIASLILITIYPVIGTDSPPVHAKPASKHSDQVRRTMRRNSI